MSKQPTTLQKLLFFLQDIQAIDVQVIDVSRQTTVTDYMIISTGRSSRHVKAIAETVLEKMKEIKIMPLSVHGLASSDWALVDFGDYVLHVMQPESRAYYNLEGLWQDNPE